MYSISNEPSFCLGKHNLSLCDKRDWVSFAAKTPVKCMYKLHFGCQFPYFRDALIHILLIIHSVEMYVLYILCAQNTHTHAHQQIDMRVCESKKMRVSNFQASM